MPAVTEFYCPKCKKINQTYLTKKGKKIKFIKCWNCNKYLSLINKSPGRATPGYR